PWKRRPRNVRVRAEKTRGRDPSRAWNGPSISPPWSATEASERASGIPERALTAPRSLGIERKVGAACTGCCSHPYLSVDTVPTNVDEFLAAVDWGGVSKRLLAYTVRRLQRFIPSHASAETAKEIVHEAIVHLLDDEHRDWNPEHPTEKELLLHLGSEINGIVINYQRKVIRRPNETSLDARYDLTTSGAEFSSLELASWLEDAANRVDEESRRILALFADGCTKAADQAAELGW